VNLLTDSTNRIEAYATLRLQNGGAIRSAGTLDFRNAFVMELNSGGLLENSGTITATSSGNNPYFGGDGTGLFRTTTNSLTRFFPSNGDHYTVSLPFDFAGQFRADSGMNVTFDRGGLLNETAKISPNHPNSQITFTGADKVYRVRGQANELPGTGYVNLNNTTLQFEPSVTPGHVSSIAAGARVAFHGNNTVKGYGTLSSTGLVFQNGDQTVDGATLQTTGGDVSIWNACGKRVQFKNGGQFRNTGRFVIQTTTGTPGNPGFYGEEGTRFHNTSTGQLVNDVNASTQFELPFQNDGELEIRAGSFDFLRGFSGTRGVAAGSYGSFLVSIVDGGKTLRLSDFQVVPATFPGWIERHRLTGDDAGTLADPLGTGLNNLLKYALGLDPKQPGGLGGPVGGVIEDGSGNRYLSISFTKPTGDDLPTDVTYAVERSTRLNLNDWSSSTEHVVSAGAPIPGPGNLQTFTFRSTHPRSSTPREFLRLRVTRN
jgi:hypothetical protein